MAAKISVDDLEAINTEIDGAHYTNIDPQTIILAAQAGLVGEKTGSVPWASTTRNTWRPDKNHIERVKRIAEAQGVPGKDGKGNSGGGDPAARGVPDLSADARRCRKRRRPPPTELAADNGPARAGCWKTEADLDRHTLTQRVRR